MDNDEAAEWAAKAFDELLRQALFAPEKQQKHVLAFLMTAPDSVKARVAEFEATKQLGD